MASVEGGGGTKFRELGRRKLRKNGVPVSRENGYAYWTDAFLKNVARYFRSQRNITDGGENMRRANGRMSGEGQFHGRRENAQAARVRCHLRGEDKHGFR